MRQTVSALAGATSLGAVGEEGPPDDCCPVGLGRGPEPGRLLAARPSQAFCESRATIWVAGVRDDLGGGEWGRAHFRERPTSESGHVMRQEVVSSARQKAVSDISSLPTLRTAPSSSQGSNLIWPAPPLTSHRDRSIDSHRVACRAARMVNVIASMTSETPAVSSGDGPAGRPPSRTVPM
jgi:hypothetical protein